MYQSVLSFWFGETEPSAWWRKDAQFDQKIRARFLPLLEQAIAGELHLWRAEPKGRLAEIILLDQFSRNCFRDTARAFAQDPMALARAQEAVSHKAHHQMTQIECTFLLMPYMHSESASIHRDALTLFKEYADPENYEFELKHKAIIDRFGRYPHRNALLGRASTSEELRFLQQPGSSF